MKSEAGGPKPFLGYGTQLRTEAKTSRGPRNVTMTGEVGHGLPAAAEEFLTFPYIPSKSVDQTVSVANREASHTAELQLTLPG